MAATTRLQELEMEDPVSEMEWSPYPGKKDDHTSAVVVTTGTNTPAMHVHGTGDNESEFDDEYDFDECDDDEDDECEAKFGGMQSRAATKRPGGVLAFRRRRDQAGKRRLGGGRQRQNSKKANHSSAAGCDGEWLHQHDDDLGCCAMHSADSAVTGQSCDQASEARRLREVVEAMPQEAWLKVIGHLTDVRDVEMSVALVSHRFYQITRENLLWKKLAKKKWGPFLKWYHHHPLLLLSSSSCVYKHYYATTPPLHDGEILPLLATLLC